MIVCGCLVLLRDIVSLAGVIPQRYPAELAEDKCIKLSVLCHAGIE